MAHSLPVKEDWPRDSFREERLSCNLPTEALKLQTLKPSLIYPRGTLLCLEGEPPRGVYILCSGRAKLSTTSAEGKTIILRIAEPGEFLGLAATVSNSPYESTIETIEPARANFIEQKDFINLLHSSPEAAMEVALQLTRQCRAAYAEIRALGLSNSVPEKIAKLLLDWAEHPLEANRKSGSTEIPFRVTLKHEEVAQFVGTTRETVSRVLSEFRRRGWLKINGVTWSILDKQALENMVTT